MGFRQRPAVGEHVGDVLDGRMSASYVVRRASLGRRARGRTLGTAPGQLVDIQVSTGAEKAHSAKQFSATGKKDLAYACIYAYVRFLVRLKLGELEFGQEGAEEGGYYVME